MVAKLDYPERIISGCIHSIQPTISESCNAQLTYMAPGLVLNTCVSLNQCYHAEDAYNAAVWSDGLKIKDATSPCLHQFIVLPESLPRTTFPDAPAGPALGDGPAAASFNLRYKESPEETVRAAMEIVAFACNTPVVTKAYSDGTVCTGPGPLPDLSPAQQDSADSRAQK